MIRVFIGYDRLQPVAYHVAAHSVIARASRPVSVAPLMLSQLGGVFRRERHALQSTDFSFTRFLVPSLCGFEGWALYLDCDMLVRADIAELWDLKDDRYVVQVVPCEHQPARDRKYQNHPQTSYARKNWSSLMLFNAARCRALTPELVNTANGLALHQFHWVDDPAGIGTLPREWNHLVDVDPPGEAKILHYTNGGPWFQDCRESGLAEPWWEELAAMLAPALSAPLERSVRR